MKKVKGYFYVDLGYVGCRVDEEFEIEFEDTATEEEIDNKLENYYNDFQSNRVNGGWIIKQIENE